jgi:hypothetical protein
MTLYETWSHVSPPQSHTIKAERFYNFGNVEKGGFPWFNGRESVDSECGIQLEDSCNCRIVRFVYKSRLVSLVLPNLALRAV